MYLDETLLTMFAPPIRVKREFEDQYLWLECAVKFQILRAALAEPCRFEMHYTDFICWNLQAFSGPIIKPFVVDEMTLSFTL